MAWIIAIVIMAVGISLGFVGGRIIERQRFPARLELAMTELRSKADEFERQAKLVAQENADLSYQLNELNKDKKSLEQRLEKVQSEGKT